MYWAKAIKVEFYAIPFGRKLYTTVDELQADVDRWFEEYNTERTHTGKYCFGKTPMQTFLDSKRLVHEKLIGRLIETSAPTVVAV